MLTKAEYNKMSISGETQSSFRKHGRKCWKSIKPFTTHNRFPRIIKLRNGHKNSTIFQAKLKRASANLRYQVPALNRLVLPFRITKEPHHHPQYGNQSRGFECATTHCHPIISQPENHPPTQRLLRLCREREEPHSPRSLHQAGV